MSIFEDTLINLIRETKALELTYADELEKIGAERRAENVVCSLEMILEAYQDYTPPNKSKAVHHYGTFARVVL